MKRHESRPFTLIELIAVMGVMMVLAAVAVPAYSSLFSGRKTTLAANKVNAAVLEARTHAVSAKVYTALVFIKDTAAGGYTSFRMAEVYHDADAETEGDDYLWRRWVPGSSVVLLPENTMIPATDNDLGVVSGGGLSQNEISKGDGNLPKVDNLVTSSGVAAKNADRAIIFKPNGQLAGTGDHNVVVRFVETNKSKSGSAPKLPLNINWLTCKTKFLDPVTD